MNLIIRFIATIIRVRVRVRAKFRLRVLKRQF